MTKEDVFDTLDTLVEEQLSFFITEELEFTLEEVRLLIFLRRMLDNAKEQT